MFNKEKTMVIVITQKKNNDGSESTRRQIIGDDLMKAEKRWVLEELIRSAEK